MLFFLIMIGMLLETLKLGLIIPTIIFVIQVDFLTNYPSNIYIHNFLGKLSHTELITIIMIGFVGVYIIKNLFLAFLISRQTNFSFNVQNSLSQWLLVFTCASLIHCNYRETQRICVPIKFTEVIISTLLMLVFKLLVLIGITIRLLFVEPLGITELDKKAVLDSTGGYKCLVH